MTQIVEIPQPLGLFAGELFDRGIEYLDAFCHLNEGKDRYSFASYFLLAHSLELLLKSFAVAHGMSKKEARKAGHRILSILQVCKGSEMPRVDHLDEFVGEIARMNSDHDFRYPTGYRLHLPSPALCIPVARGLIAAVSPTIERARIEARIDFHGDPALRGKKVRWSD